YGVCYSLFCFFFQAEDGIRDFHVTGVQTCALPILDGIGRERRNATALDGGDGLLEGTALFECQIRHVGLLNGRILMDALSHRSEIGRASCRERREISMVAGPGKKRVSDKRRY